MLRSAVVAALVGILAGGCGKYQVSVVDPARSPDASGASSADGASFTLAPPTDGGAPLPTGVVPLPPDSSDKCAEEAVEAQVAPLDLVLVLDASGSMNTEVDGKTKWSRVLEALTAFLHDPRSRGLGVGLQVFPFTIDQKACTTNADCGFDDGPEGYWCQQPFVCNDPAVPLEMARSCDPNDAFCPLGVKCVQAGRCATSGARCLNLGQACSAAGGACGLTGKVCKMPLDSCTPADYQQPRVAIAELPAGEAALLAGLTAVKPAGGTPIAPAFDGAAAHLRSYAQTHPGHGAALVLATDGAPNGCDGNDEAGIAARLTAVHGGTPAIPTYVIGVLSAMDAATIQSLTRFAAAGGTATPFLLNATADLGQKFLAALDQIRAQALPCEVGIPRPTQGAIDFARVNVRYTGSGGTDDLFNVTGADRCDPTKGGWYYDVPPGSGTPSRIAVCDATCRRFKMDPGGRLELRFGCRTRIIE